MLGGAHLRKSILSGLQAYSHHMVLRLTAQIGQSLKKTASRDWKFAFMTAAVSSPQQRGVAGLRKGHADAKFWIAA